MSKIRNISIFALALIIIGTIGGLLTFKQSQRIETVAVKKDLNQNFTALDVHINNASLEIIPTNGSITKVELRGKKSAYEDEKLFAQVQGKTLVVRLLDHQRKFYSFDFLYKPLSLKLFVPKKQYETLQVSCDNGEIVAGQFNTKTINARTNNGKIQLTNIPSTSVNVDSDNGEIILKNVDGSLTGGTNNGHISLETKTIDRPIQFHSDNGSIDIKTEKDPVNVRFDVSVENGSVNILNQYHGGTVIGNGKNLVKLSTNNGVINVTK